MKNKKHNIKPIPYSEESLGKKDNYLKIFLSLLESFLILPIVNPVLSILNITQRKTLILVIFYLLVTIVAYILKKASKRFDFSKWDFLDDEVVLFSNDNTDNENADFCISKFIFFLVVNLAIIVPLSLTFSTILASSVTFAFTFFVDDVLVDIVKFALIAIIFKGFFNPLNEKFIAYIIEEKL